MFKFETHAHTSETSSCGKLPANELIKLYSEAGFSGICITDHYQKQFLESRNGTWKQKIDEYLAGYRAAAEAGEKYSIKVVLGIEFRNIHSSNDYLIYGLTEDFLYENQELYNLTLPEMKKLSDKNSLSIYQAHPFRPGMTVVKAQYLDGVEVFNGNPRHNSSNPAAYSYALVHNLTMLSGSDCHQQEDVARGGILLPGLPDNSKELAEMISAHKHKLLCTFDM